MVLKDSVTQTFYVIIWFVQTARIETCSTCIHVSHAYGPDLDLHNFVIRYICISFFTFKSINIKKEIGRKIHFDYKQSV